MNSFINNLHQNGQHYGEWQLCQPFIRYQILLSVIIIDPGIKTESGYKTYDDGISMDIFIKVSWYIYNTSTRHPLA